MPRWHIGTGQLWTSWEKFLFILGSWNPHEFCVPEASYCTRAADTALPLLSTALWEGHCCLHPGFASYRSSGWSLCFCDICVPQPAPECLGDKPALQLLSHCTYRILHCTCAQCCVAKLGPIAFGLSWIFSLTPLTESRDWQVSLPCLLTALLDTDWPDAGIPKVKRTLCYEMHNI